MGRVTGYLLQGLAELQPDGEWVLWGPPSVDRYLWAGARAVRSFHSPTALAAQRELASVPASDVALFPHAVRPLVRRARTAVMLHDVIPALYGGGRARLLAWRTFFRLSVRQADVVLVYSRATTERARSLLGVPQEALRPVRLPLDLGMVARVRGRRAASPARGGMLYVGQAKPHKNLERALVAFAGSQFGRRGGTFVLAGAVSPGREALEAFIGREGISGARVLPRVSDEELEGLYADASFVIQPSLEEGLGLPVVEALAMGIPVCCSAIPSLLEAAGGRAETFDPWSVPSIRAAIDRVAGAAPPSLPEPDLPTPDQFARQVLDAVL